MSGMMRVTPANRCPICGGDTWCVVGHTIVICMRTVSDKPHTFKGGETGYKHPHPDPNKKLPWSPKKEYRPPVINARRVLYDWKRAYELEQKRLPVLAADLGVTVDSLNMLECQATGGWPRTWGFPMKDGYGNYIGIRLRNEWGKKWAVTGSQAGIFIPVTVPHRRVFIVEGPTDTAAGLSMGLFTLGRPSCSGGVTHICDYIHRREFVKDVVIIADNDDPGIRGAKELQRWLKVPSCVLTLPCKDLREFNKIGDRSTLDSMVDQLTWTQPEKQNESDR